MSPEAASAFAASLSRIGDAQAAIEAGLGGITLLCPQWSNTGLLDVDAASGTVRLIARHGPVNDLFEGLPTRWPLGISPARALLRGGETQFVADMRESEAFPLYRVDAGIQGYRSVAMLLLDGEGTRARVVSCHADRVLTREEAGLPWLELALAMMQLALARTTQRDDAVKPGPHPALAGLAGRSDLIETARAFSLHEGRFQRAADALGIHVSTLRYRLGILRDGHGIDLADPELRRAIAASP